MQIKMVQKVNIIPAYQHAHKVIKGNVSILPWAFTESLWSLYSKEAREETTDKVTQPGDDFKASSNLHDISR